MANLDDNSVSQIDPRSATVKRTLILRRGGHRRAGDERRSGVDDGLPARDRHCGSIRPSATWSQRIHVGRTPWSAGAGGPSPSRPRVARCGQLPATRPLPARRAFGPRGDDDRGRQRTGGIAACDGATWVADDADNTVSRIDAGGVATGPLPVGKGASGIAVGAGAVWVANTLDDTVTRIDPATGETKATIPVGAGPRGLAVGLGAVWVADSRGAGVSRIDPRTDRVVRRSRSAEAPRASRRCRPRVGHRAGKLTATRQAGGRRHPAHRAAERLRLHRSGDPVAASATRPINSSTRPAPSCSTTPTDPRGRERSSCPRSPRPYRGSRRDGRTYTFTLRPGFRFSPPSNEPVTARAFQRAIERFLSPRCSPAAVDRMADIVGASAYRAGERHTCRGSPPPPAL